VIAAAGELDRGIQGSNEACDAKHGVELKRHGAEADQGRPEGSDSVLDGFADPRFMNDQIHYLDVVVGEIAGERDDSKVGQAIDIIDNIGCIRHGKQQDLQRKGSPVVWPERYSMASRIRTFGPAQMARNALLESKAEFPPARVRIEASNGAQRGRSFINAGSKIRESDFACQAIFS
jgi:hypothetical protein